MIRCLEVFIVQPRIFQIAVDDTKCSFCRTANAVLAILGDWCLGGCYKNKGSEVAEMGDRLATIDMARKVGAAVPLSVEELGLHLTQCRLPPYQVAS